MKRVKCYFKKDQIEVHGDLPEGKLNENIDDETLELKNFDIDINNIPELVNQQNKDMFNDLLFKDNVVIR